MIQLNIQDWGSLTDHNKYKYHLNMHQTNTWLCFSHSDVLAVCKYLKLRNEAGYNLIINKLYKENAYDGLLIRNTLDYLQQESTQWTQKRKHSS